MNDAKSDGEIPAKKAGDKRYEVRRQEAFTLIELLIAFSIALVLMSLVFAGGKQVLAGAQSSKCVANLKQMGTGMNAYIADHDGMLIPGAEIPSGNWWYNVLEQYMGGTTNQAYMPSRPQWQQCPAKRLPPGEVNVGYGWNFQNFGGTDPADWGSAGEYCKVSSIPKPAQTIIIGCTPKYVDAPWRNAFIYRDSPSFSTNHSGAGNYLFLDWHVEQVQTNNVLPLLERYK